MEKISSKFRSYLSKYNQQLWIISIGTFINNLGIQVLLIFFALYLLKLGVSMSVIGTVMLITILIYALFSSAGGILSDRFGRKHSMLVGLGICTIVLTVMGLTKSVIFLIVLHFLFSAGLGLTETSQRTMVADVTSHEKMVEAYGLIGSASMLGAGVGAMGGGFLAAKSYSLIFYLSALTCFIYFGTVLFLLAESLPSKPKTSAHITGGYAFIVKDSPFLFFCMLSVVFAISAAQSQTSFNVYATSWIKISESELGLLWSINTWIVALVQYPISIQIGKFRKPFYVLFSSALLCAISFQIVLFSKSFPPLIAYIVIFTFSGLLFSPVSSSLVANYATKKERGRMLGFYIMSLNIGAAVSPFIGLQIMDTFSGAFLWPIVTIISILSGFGYLFFNKLTGHKFKTVILGQPQHSQASDV